jgi:LysM repeat protein
MGDINLPALSKHIYKVNMLYNIAKGDTLSGIAQKNKKSLEELMKANPSITDPNKIGIGQSLNIPDTTATQTTSTTPIQEVITPKTPKEILLQKMTDYFTNSSKPQTDTVSPLQEKSNQYTTQINETLDLLNNLRSNIKERTGGLLFSEAQRARLQANEQAPLTQSLETLQRGKSSVLEQLTATKSTEETARKAPLEELKTLADVYGTYEKANEVPKLDTSIVEVGGRKLLVNNQTGQTVKDLGKATNRVTDTTDIYNQAQLYVEQNKDKMTSEQLRAELLSSKKLTVSQVDAIIKGSESTKKFLTPEYIQKLFTPEQLKKAASDAGFTKSTGLFGWGSGEGDTDAYLKYLSQAIEQYRASGLTDQEILKQMQ